MSYVSVNVDVDIHDVIHDIPTEDLVSELKSRGEVLFATDLSTSELISEIEVRFAKLEFCVSEISKMKDILGFGGGKSE